MAEIRCVIARRWPGTAMLVLALALAGCDDPVDATLPGAESIRTSTSEVVQPPTQAAPSADARTPEGPFSPAQERLVASWHEWNSGCRGGRGGEAATWHACAVRDGTYRPRMREAGLCHGKVSDGSSAEMEWHLCQSDSLGYREQPPHMPQGRCRVVMEGRTMLDGTCMINLEEDGSFWVLDTAHHTFASVQRYDGRATAITSVEGLALADGGHLGEVTRHGACWSNTLAEICAWR